MAKVYDVEVTPGRGWSRLVKVTSGGSPMDLTGAEVLAQIRAHHDPAAELLATIGVTMTAPAVGEFALALTAATSADVVDSSYWDTQVRLPGGEPFTLLAGLVRTTAPITS